MDINLYTAWIAFLLGVLTGAVPGLFFHRENWLGGYNAWRRRLARLAHISLLWLGHPQPVPVMDLPSHRYHHRHPMALELNGHRRHHHAAGLLPIRMENGLSILVSYLGRVRSFSPS